jgi:hypothetical protein
MSIKDRNLTVGTKLVGKYHKQQHTCQVVAGEGDKVRYKLSDGREFKSPSAAGMAITGHACDGWVFWSVETATENSQAENQQEANANVTENTSQMAPEATTAKKNFLRTPNQRGAPQGQTRWFCAECGESFLAPYGEIPTACPQGHKA